MKKTFFLLLFFNLAFFSYSQTSYKSGRTANSKDSLARYRFEVGTDLLWLVDKNSLPGYCLQLKINTNSKKHPGAFRFKVGMDLKTKDSSLLVSDPNLYYRTSDETFYFRSGYQLNYTLSRVKVYWGADLHFLYDRHYLDKYSQPELFADNNYYDAFLTYKVAKLQYGIIGLVGSNYQLAPRISISLETNISFLFSRIKSEAYLHYKEFPNYKNTGGGKEANILNIKFIPISTINLIINF